MLARLLLLMFTAMVAFGQPQNLDRQMAAIVKARKVPGIAAVVFSKDQVLGTGVAGLREIGKPEKIVLNDRFHIGSNAKAMLATALATLVESGQLRWEARPPDVLELPDVYPAYGPVSVARLLTHHAGFAAYDDPDSLEWKQWTASRRESESPLRAFSIFAFKQLPVVTPGTDYLYSNAGYAVGGAIIEKLSGTPWTDFLRQRVFVPLGMNADFGYPGAGQPSGHLETKKGFTVADRADQLPPELQPAGDVQLSVLDYAKFLQAHMRGLAGEDGILKSTTMRTLDQPDGKAAMGWGVREFEGAESHVHSGSAGSFYTVTVLQPSLNLGVAVMINSGGARADQTCGEVVRKLLAQFRK